jgi:hypothetical protein
MAENKPAPGEPKKHGEIVQDERGQDQPADRKTARKSGTPERTRGGSRGLANEPQRSR